MEGTSYGGNDDELMAARASPLRSLEEVLEPKVVRAINTMIERLICPLKKEIESVGDKFSAKMNQCMVGGVLELMVVRAVNNTVMPMIENLIRRLIKEEIEKAADKLSARMNQNSANDICNSICRSAQLKFLNNISDIVLTGNTIKADDCNSIQLALVDDNTGEVIKSGAGASVEVEIDALKDDLTPELLDDKIVKEKNCLSGNALVKLQEGIGVLDNIKFKHGARWTKKCKVRLLAKPLKTCSGLEIKAAKTKSFVLMDKRNKHSKKRRPLSLTDDVCRLKHIRKGHTTHERLFNECIKTLKDFLVMLFIDPERLQQILGEDAKWDETFDEARKCVIDEKMYLYCPNSSQNYGTVFNCVGQLLGEVSQRQYIPVNKLPECVKANAQKQLPDAFERKDNVIKLRDNLLCFANEASLLEHFSQPLTGNDLSNFTSVEDPCNLIQTRTALQDYSPLDDFWFPDQEDDFGLSNHPPSGVQTQNNSPTHIHSYIMNMLVDMQLLTEDPSVNSSPDRRSLIPLSGERSAFAEKKWGCLLIVLKSVKWKARMTANMNGHQVSKKQRLC